MSEPRCWGFRISTDNIEYLADELEQGRLRQGWGWHEGQNLLKMTFDQGARRNLRMLDVLRGDLLLVPRLPEWDQVSIVQATDDWRSGYKFRIDPDVGDFGHIFPARRLKAFVRGNEHVAGDIRASLRNPSRFWKIDHLRPHVLELLGHTESELGSAKDPVEKARDIAAGLFKRILDNGKFKDKVFCRLNEKLEGKDWEPVLQAVIASRYPTAIVDVVQGKSEAYHGTDILVKLPDITGEPRYAIAIQVKDHVGIVGAAAVEQISKADFWEKTLDLKLIQRVVVFTRATRDNNEALAKMEEETGLQIVFRDALLKILEEWTLHHAATTLL